MQYYQSGKILSIARAKNGTYVDSTIYYRENGGIDQIVYYENGKLFDVKLFDENGERVLRPELIPLTQLDTLRQNSQAYYIIRLGNLLVPQHRNGTVIVTKSFRIDSHGENTGNPADTIELVRSSENYYKFRVNTDSVGSHVLNFVLIFGAPDSLSAYIGSPPYYVKP